MASPTVTLAEHLATRLHQLGVRHLFGIPGDFSLGLVDALSAAGRQEWVGTANELDAGYAADGYARRAGLGALCTTFGVGELSAINAVAGAYAENVPLVQITGSPRTGAVAAGALLHHTLGDGDFGYSLRAYQQVTAAAQVLTAQDPAGQVDELLRTAITELRPVYLAVPADLVQAPVDAGRLAEPLHPRPADARALDGLRQALTQALAEPGPGPVLLVGHLVQRLALQPQLRALADTGRVRVASLLSGLGELDAAHPAHLGTYAGELGWPQAREAVEAAGPVIGVGTLMADVVSGFFTARPASISLDATSARVGSATFEQVPLAAALAVLHEVLASGEERPPATRRSPAPADPTGSTGSTGAEALDQVRLWQGLRTGLGSGRTVVSDIGTCFWGLVGGDLPADTRLVAQPVWSSIGYALPAMLGAALAEPERRPVLLIGDGAAQMTAAELGLLARRAPGALVVLVDNDGYTIERALHSPEAAYHDIAGWDWPTLLRGLAPHADPLVLTARTPAELADGLSRSQKETQRLTFLRVVVPAQDVPPMLQALAATAARTTRSQS